MPASYPPLPEAVREKLQGHYAFNESFLQRWLAPCKIDLEAGVIVAPSSFHADYLTTRYETALNHALGKEMKIIARPPPTKSS